jgi:hypothetical protein
MLLLNSIVHGKLENSQKTNKDLHEGLDRESLLDFLFVKETKNLRSCGFRDQNNDWQRLFWRCSRKPILFFYFLQIHSIFSLFFSWFPINTPKTFMWWKRSRNLWWIPFKSRKSEILWCWEENQSVLQSCNTLSRYFFKIQLQSHRFNQFYDF